MSGNIYIKLKSQLSKKSKKLYLPSSFEDLLNKIQSFLNNNNPNKIYQIFDVKSQKIIKDQNDYIVFKNECQSDHNRTLLINLVDKTNIDIIPAYIPESSSIFIQSSIFPKKNEHVKEKEKEKEDKEMTEEEKIKESLHSFVQSKLKILENKLLNEIINKTSSIHKGIKCNECGINDIKGIRYKCTKCLNFNLCEKCEEKTDHDENHILLKIRKPVDGEDAFNKKINSSIAKFSNKNYNDDYIIEPNIFLFQKKDLVKLQRINLKNNGNTIFKKGFQFKCVKEKSNLKLNDFIFPKDIEPGNSIDIELICEEQVNDKIKYYTSYKLIDDKSNQIGSIQTFNIEVL